MCGYFVNVHRFIVLLFYVHVHSKHLRSCRDGQLTYPHFSWTSLDLLNDTKYFVNKSMWPEGVSNPGFLGLETDALPTEIRGPADYQFVRVLHSLLFLR